MYTDENALYFRGKLLVRTGHFHEECYGRYRKNLHFALELLENGAHEKDSKEKMRVLKRSRNGVWELVYVECPSEIVLIHLKLRR